VKTEKTCHYPPYINPPALPSWLTGYLFHLDADIVGKTLEVILFAHHPPGNGGSFRELFPDPVCESEMCGAAHRRSLGMRRVDRFSHGAALGNGVSRGS
jgi:hypothetical protein